MRSARREDGLALALLAVVAIPACGDRSAPDPAEPGEPVTVEERADQALERGDRDAYLEIVESEIDAMETWARAFERDLARGEESASPQVRSAFQRFRDDLREALSEVRQLRDVEGETFEERARALGERLEGLDHQVLTIEEMRLRDGRT